MRPLSSILIALAAAAALVTSATGTVWLADYRGHDYTWPLPENFTTDGQFYAAVGPVISMNEDYFVLTPDDFEYTIHIHSGTLTAADTVGTYVFYYYEAGDGRIRLYEDSRLTGTLFEYGTYPPNPTTPSTFIDGTFMLGGSFTSFTIMIETIDGDGTFSGTIDFNEGDYLENLPPDMRDGWTFTALGLGHPPHTPEGFMNQMDGEIYLEQGPTPTEPSSWGRIKNLFR